LHESIVTHHFPYRQLRTTDVISLAIPPYIIYELLDEHDIDASLKSAPCQAAQAQGKLH
jgi:hypothetical protein